MFCVFCLVHVIIIKFYLYLQDMQYQGKHFVDVCAVGSLEIEASISVIHVKYSSSEQCIEFFFSGQCLYF